MILGVAECAVMLRCSEPHLQRLAREGTIPACKVGKDWIFIEEDIVDWLRKKSQPNVVIRKIGRPRKLRAV